MDLPLIFNSYTAISKGYAITNSCSRLQVVAGLNMLTVSLRESIFLCLRFNHQRALCGFPEDNYFAINEFEYSRCYVGHSH